MRHLLSTWAYSIAQPVSLLVCSMTPPGVTIPRVKPEGRLWVIALPTKLPLLINSGDCNQNEDHDAAQCD
jgi:hypothetical protein